MTKALRIGIDGTPLVGQRSGVGYYTAHLLQGLLQEVPEWEYLLYSNRPLNGLDPALSKATQVSRYFHRSRWLWMQTVLPHAIRQSQPDVCHFTNSIAPIWQPRPSVLTIHDVSLFVYGQFHPTTRHLAMRLLLPLAARRATAVITISHYSRSELVRVLGLPADRIHVIYEAAAPQFQPVTDPQRLQAVRRRYRLPERFMLYVGTIEPRKNLRRLVAAAREARRAGCQHELVLAGPAGWLMRDFITELEAEEGVRYLGYVDRRDLPALYTMADLFVFPSLYEGFGLPPMEAMACGAPVLTSNNSSLAEVYGEAAWLAAPDDVAALVSSLRTLLGDDALRRDLSERGLAHARSFSWRRAARDTAAVYRQVMASNGSQISAAKQGVPD